MTMTGKLVLAGCVLLVAIPLIVMMIRRASRGELDMGGPGVPITPPSPGDVTPGPGGADGGTPGGA